MSKKNKKSTKRSRHAFDLQREKLEVVKKQLKVQKKQEKIAVDPSKVGKKKLKGIRIKKGVRVEGIKITDAASKRKARQALEAEQALRKMEVESEAGWEEAAPSDMEDAE